jgi:hypothetical protein
MEYAEWFETMQPHSGGFPKSLSYSALSVQRPCGDAYRRMRMEQSWVRVPPGSPRNPERLGQICRLPAAGGRGLLRMAGHLNTAVILWVAKANDRPNQHFTSDLELQRVIKSLH